MANVQHSALTGSDLHEPKGVASAAASKVYISNGAGSGSWRYFPHSHCYYSNIGVGTTYTAPVAYTLINPTTTGDSSAHDFTHNSAGRFTYTGTSTLDVTMEASITIKHSSSTDVDVYFKFYKNGSAVTGMEAVSSAKSGVYQNIALRGHFSMATSDYVEIYTKTASGDITVHALTFSVLGHI